MEKKSILLLEDDFELGETLQELLESEGYNVTLVDDGNKALDSSYESKFDLYIFDINVPGISGLNLLKSLREFNDTTPAIFITAYQEFKYLKEGFDLGANDFLRKPFELEELQVRIENIKRQFNIDEMIIIAENVYFNVITHQLFIKDIVVPIAAKESALLRYLISNKHRVVSTEEMLHNLWEYDEMPTDDTIRTYIKKLRHILGKEHILNIRGEGYRFE